MKQYNPQDIRNVGVIGHGGAGKTSVAEAMLFLSGVNIFDNSLRRTSPSSSTSIIVTAFL